MNSLVRNFEFFLRSYAANIMTLKSSPFSANDANCGSVSSIENVFVVTNIHECAAFHWKLYNANDCK